MARPMPELAPVMTATWLSKPGFDDEGMDPTVGGDHPRSPPRDVSEKSVTETGYLAVRWV